MSHSLTPQYDSWADLMSQFESSVADSQNPESVVDAAAHVAWTPPLNLGPLPLHLVEQARRILAEQRESISNLEEMYRETGRHLAAIRSVPRESDGASVYLDVTG